MNWGAKLIRFGLRARKRRFLGLIAMYQPDHYRVADLPQLHALMRARPFATLVSNGALGRLKVWSVHSILEFADMTCSARTLLR